MLSPFGPAEQLQGGSSEISASSFWMRLDAEDAMMWVSGWETGSAGEAPCVERGRGGESETRAGAISFFLRARVSGRRAAATRSRGGAAPRLAVDSACPQGRHKCPKRAW